MFKIILFLVASTLLLFGFYHLLTNLGVDVKLWLAKKLVIATICFLLVIILSVCIVAIF